MPAILELVNAQLLASDFADSMVPGTGFPANIIGAEKAVLEGPILVEVVGMMEIGHSAYSLLQTYESREEYRKQAALREAREPRDGEERKPMPKYPRSMLQFQLSDGSAILPAIENKPFPEFELGETPLGIKMILRNASIRRGTALLKPDCVQVMEGTKNDDRDAQRDAIFFRALKARLGEDVPEPEPAPDDQPAPAQDPVAAPRPALRDISPAAPDADIGHANSPRRVEREHDDDMGQPRRRKRPSRVGRSPSPDPPPRDVALQRSRFFSKPASGASASGLASANAGADEDADVGRVRVNSGDAGAMRSLAQAIGLSPPRAPPVNLPESDEDENPLLSPSANGNGKGKQRAELSFGEPGSEDYDFEFDVDESFLEQVDRAAQEALLRGTTATSTANATANTTFSTTATAVATTTNGRASSVQAPQTQTRVKPEPRSQSAARALFATGHRRGGSVAAGPASSSSGGAGADAPMDVIDISDDEVEGDKENVPVPTRHVRRRVAPEREPPQEDVIELSD
ncbi:hypothetical protein TRAPUB_12012 [Trametes pubescens]|uniref:RecQ-mediated genome instability protein 1 n=1 Tax=Trametes pubescens TaxID=154538 RepID=A0A1M2VVC4_TRAPU|nr:hypothetical protein TRAPUB_12012 [Trametes pubescens]